MKKYVRTVFILLTVTLLFSVSGIPAYGDVIWEPMEDNFYKTEYENCVHMGRTFIANSPAGHINVYKNPKSSTVIDQFENGNLFYVSFTYEDINGGSWGVVQYAKDVNGRAEMSYSGKAATGWIPMPDLMLQYDNASFLEEHSSEFKEYSGEFDGYEAQGDTILFWTYPGSGVISSRMSDKEINENFSISSIYSDADDRLWGNVGYFMGRRGWLCISDPTNESIPAVDIKYDNLYPASRPAAVSNQAPVLFLIIGLVGIAAVSTVVLIRLFWHKNNNGEENS